MYFFVSLLSSPSCGCSVNQVEAESERIGKDEVESKMIAASAQKDLNKALPMLQAAMEQVDKLDKGAISEVRGAAPGRMFEPSSCGSISNKRRNTCTYEYFP
jgi:hypothetical protein